MGDKVWGRGRWAPHINLLLIVEGLTGLVRATGSARRDFGGCGVCFDSGEPQADPSHATGRSRGGVLTGGHPKMSIPLQLFRLIFSQRAVASSIWRNS